MAMGSAALGHPSFISSCGAKHTFCQPWGRPPKRQFPAPYPLQRKDYEKDSPRIFLCDLLGSTTAKYVITKKAIPQKLYCVIGGCRDLKLFHVELCEVYATPEEK